MLQRVRSGNAVRALKVAYTDIPLPKGICSESSSLLFPMGILDRKPNEDGCTWREFTLINYIQ